MDELLLDVKPKVRDVKVKDQDEANREELFREIEALDVLADLSLSSSLKENVMDDQFPTQDTANSRKTIKPKELCVSCNIHVTDMKKHVRINKCGTLPFPLMKGSSKTLPLKKSHNSSRNRDTQAESI